MKKINWKQFFLFMVLNCIIIYGIVILGFRKPQVAGLNKVEFIGGTDKFINFRINLAVKNPNFFSVGGKNLSVQFTESGFLLGEGSITPFRLERAGQSDLEIIMKVYFRQVIKSYKDNNSDFIEPAISVTGSFIPAFFIHTINLKKQIPKREIFDLLLNAVSKESAIPADSFSLHKILRIHE